jgi:deoxyribodipyrimidine photo-lyase
MRKGTAVHPERIRILKSGPETVGPVLYWMSRDQRCEDNWALLYGQELALSRKAPLAVVFCLVEDFLGATARQYDFMIRGLIETSVSLSRKSIPFFLRVGEPSIEIPRMVGRLKAGALVTDFDPLRIKCHWKKSVAGRIKIPFMEVDAHNIVPCRAASSKREWGAYTMRPKINRLLHEFLVPFPKLIRHPFSLSGSGEPGSLSRISKTAKLRLDKSVPPVPSIDSGPKAAQRRLKRFIKSGLSGYGADRNNPVMNGQSGLSPYLHFGQLSPQRAALDILSANVDPLQKEIFLEELIVRRELADNFCHYNPDYDSVLSFPAWAAQSLEAHRKDPREYRYKDRQFEEGDTHDPLWNAAQMEMVRTGKMHGYMRMYWAKKILEWSENSEQAMETAIRLNDRYELDGRDPNGYAGIAWSIGGVHDRAWGERPVFGKVRYMSAGGCRKKFDTDEYIRNNPSTR